MKKPNFAAMNPVVAEAIQQIMAEQVNIPVAGYRQSGEMETVVPAFWKPLFRRFGNRCPARTCSGC